MKTYHTYILESKKNPDQCYIGFTDDLESCLKTHNQGRNSHTSQYKPWRIRTSITFTDRRKALAFEAYLKSQPGREFAKKRL